jgi:hypothetical protein
VAFTFDPATDRGKVRLLIDDDVEAYEFFSDAKVDAFLDLNDGNVRLAAADALDSWASNEAMVTKAVRRLDVSTNGPAVAAALREHASRLRELADKEDTDAGFDVAEMYLGPASWAE